MSSPASGGAGTTSSEKLIPNWTFIVGAVFVFVCLLVAALLLAACYACSKRSPNSDVDANLSHMRASFDRQRALSIVAGSNASSQGRGGSRVHPDHPG